MNNSTPSNNLLDNNDQEASINIDDEKNIVPITSNTDNDNTDFHSEYVHTVLLFHIVLT